MIPGLEQYPAAVPGHRKGGARERPARAGLLAWCFVLVAVCVTCLAGNAAADGLPRSEAELKAAVRTAIESGDYATFEQLVYWDGAGKIKKRVVAYQVRRGLGRQIREISVAPFDEQTLHELKTNERHRLNMPVTHELRVVFDEPPVNAAGMPPTSVFLVGKRDDVYRIALMVRKFDDDDD